MAKCTNIKLDVQTGTDRTIYATWTWNKTHTDHYEIRWYYDTGDGVWFVGTDSTTTSKQNTYSAPDNAKRVGFKVKPVPKKVKKTVKAKNGSKKTVKVNAWNADWSTLKYYNIKNNPPSTPPAPTVTIENLKLTAKLENINLNATDIQFQIVKNDSKVFKTGTATIKTYAASYFCAVTAGYNYKVRCRAIRGKEHSAWSEYSSDQGTQPAASKGWEFIKALTSTSVEVNWYGVKNATTYEIEYTTEKRYFDSSNQVQSLTVDATLHWSHAEITGLETGKEWFFRMRAVNDNGHSAWTEIKSIVLGKDPIAPTTWSSTTTCVVGEPLILYWVHNAEDGSSQKYAELELTIDGRIETYTIENTTDENEKDKTSSYSIDTSSYVEGTKIQWRVRTSGITNTYGDWSIQRTVDIYAPPTLELSVTDANGNLLETLTSFPFYISGIAGPNTQNAIGYHLSIIANESYEAIDQIGNVKMVNQGEEIYSKFFDTSENLVVEMSANNIDLENNINYKVNCVVSMNSGLTAESSSEFTVAWTDEQYEPNAEIGFNEDDISTYIRPYCENDEGNLIEGVMLSVYRREFDGSFTELATNIDNMTNTYITDPHPALDYARYRIVAISSSTGAVSYYDMPGYPIGEKSLIIQWDEQWSTFDISNEIDGSETVPWSGSLLKLPYNVDVSDSYSPDVELVEYIGRKHPVSYYGTQRGTSQTFNAEIDKKDEETLYALRRLAIWMGDVYVREPSGSGYWANITVSFSQTHREVTIPVTLNVTRVEGGA